VQVTTTTTELPAQ